MVGVTATAQARLGETPDQLVKRYGEPLSQVKQAADGTAIALVFANFQKSGFEIEVTLSNGVSVAESFRKLNGDILTLNEVRTLLADNAQGRAWEAPVFIKDQKRWVSDDGTVATLTGSRILNLTSIELLNQEAQAKKVERAPSLEGF